MIVVQCQTDSIPHVINKTLCDYTEIAIPPSSIRIFVWCNLPAVSLRPKFFQPLMIYRYTLTPHMSFFSSLNIIYSMMPSANLQSLPRLRAVHKDGIKHPVYLKGNSTRDTLCVSLCILDSIPVCLSACLFHSVSVL